MKIGFFGGSFDPIHFGHISLCLELMEKRKLDQVLFCPAFCSPLKGHSPPKASAEHRLQMLRLALQEIPHFQITTIELAHPGLSFTIDTIRILLAQFSTLHLLLSEDAAAQLDQWKNAEELIRLAPPLIGSRSQGAPLQGEWRKKVEGGITQTKIMDISSTEIRDRIEKNLYCGHLVPEKSLKYIHEHRLYRNPTH